MLKTIPILLLLLADCCMVFGQNEKRISKEKIPASIVKYVHDKYAEFKKVKYFVVTDSSTVLYQVSLKEKEQELNLEFFENGELYEIEREEQFDHLPAATQANIQAELRARYKKFKLLKVESVNPHLKKEYELSIKAKTESGRKFLEVFFDESGKLIRIEEKVLKPIQTMF